MGVDVIAGSANMVVSGVVDSLFGVLRALLPGQTVQMGTHCAAFEAICDGRIRHQCEYGYRTRDGGAGKARSQGHPEEGQRGFVEVSLRPPSLKSHLSARDDHEKGSEETEEGSEEEGSV